MSADREARDRGPLPGWPGPDSPFHAGEQFLQERAGVRALAERAGWKIIRAEMPPQHRELFEELPYLVVGSLDAWRRPWATVLAGAPGFVRSPDSHTLSIAAVPGAADPLAAALVPGVPVGVLGIQLATRRRNRANGVVTARDDRSITIEIRQSFGNCPQYIQAREPLTHALPPAAPPTPERALLSPAARALIAAADTLFIASATPDAGRAASATPDAGHAAGASGADVSHRGGHPGFVRIDDRNGATVLTMPDFSGNNLFNTLGNLLREPRAGLVFPDFATGALLSLTGRTELLHDGPEVTSFLGAQRLVRFHVTSGAHLPARIPAAWSPPVPARELARTGRW